MNPDRFEYLSREFASGGMSRRATLKAVAAGGIAAFFGRGATDVEAARKCDDGPCAKRNWCADRTHTCGPSGGQGKCMVRRFGGKNFCGEILFQTDDCNDCKTSCVDCVCVLAAGGDDKCNNGVSGSDYVCVQRLA